MKLDGELHGHFFRDEDVAELASDGVDLVTKAALLSASVVARYCWASPWYGAWCPYATAGAGAIHARFGGTAHASGSESFAKAQTDPTLTGGVGITNLFTRHVGLRVDARYFRALVEADAPDGGYFEDYGFLRVAAGVSVFSGALKLIHSWRGTEIQSVSGVRRFRGPPDQTPLPPAGWIAMTATSPAQ